MTVQLHAERRQATTRAELHKVRHSGKVPGVLYGKELAEPVPVSIDARQVEGLLRTNPHALIELDVPGVGKHPVMVAQVQRDAMSRELLHLDFHSINLNEKVRTPVRLEFVGKAAGEKEGGMLQVVLHELEVECLPNKLPETIPVPIADMQMGDHLSVGDIKLPEGVRTTADPDTVVVALLAPQKDRTEAEAEAMDDAAEENESQAKSAARVETK